VIKEIMTNAESYEFWRILETVGDSSMLYIHCVSKKRTNFETV